MLGEKTIRKRPLLHGSSPSSDTGSPGRLSPSSRKSPGVVSLKTGGAAAEYVDGTHKDISKWFKAREYILIVVEAFLSLTAYVISQRNTSREELERVKLTLRAFKIRNIYFEGYSTIVSMIIGFVADSYLRHYTIALFTVILHFAAICLVFMEETVKGNQKGNPYAEVLWNVCTVVGVLIKSSDFIRLVYGLEGMTGRRKSIIYTFIFVHFWVSSYAFSGGVIVNLFAPVFSFTNTRLTIVAFIGTGISLYLFVYVLYPEVPYKEHKGLGFRIVGCLLLALYYKTFRIRVRGKRGFFSNTELKYDKATVSRTREIIILYALLLPAFGMAFYEVFKSDIFCEVMFKKVKTDEFTEVVGLKQLVTIFSYPFMLLSFFGLWPLLTLIGLKKKRDTVTFLVGHFLALVVMIYAGSLTKDLEYPKYSSCSGFIRIYNTRKQPIRFEPRDLDFTKRYYTVDPKTAVMIAYPCRKYELFAMHAVFQGTTTNFSFFFSVTRDRAIGYMAVDPPDIVRIRGLYLPLSEGPPGTNMRSWPRIFIYNTAETLKGSSIRIRLNLTKDTFKTVGEVVLSGGVMSTIVLKPATYEFFIPQADIRKSVKIEEGAVYGMMVFATPTSREMEIDTVVPPNTTPWFVLIGTYIVIGLANGLGIPSLRAIVFNIAPRGLPAMSFSYIAFLEGISLWVMYIGFITWHLSVTSNVIFIYSFGLTLFFTVNLFVLLKFKDHYS